MSMDTILRIEKRAKNHTDIWFETIDELEEETKMLFLHREKLAIEELMAKKVSEAMKK